MGRNIEGTTRRTLVAAAVTVPLAALAVLAPAGTAGAADRAAVVAVGDLRDLQPAAPGALDGAQAELTLAGGEGTTFAVLRVQHVDAPAGTRYGVHLHTGPCVPGNGAAAGPHYNHDVATGVPVPEVSPRTEVWLDFEVNPGGAAVAQARVPFVAVPGERSVVVHALPTAPDGTAGARLACLPVVW